MQRLSFIFPAFLVCIAVLSTVINAGALEKAYARRSRSAEASDLKSPKKAFLLSLVLPGMGEYYAGQSKTAKFFLGAEAAVWAGFFTFREYASLRENDYKVFLSVHAGSNPKDKPDEFFDDLGFYSSVYEHNRLARWNSGPEAIVYAETGEWIWEWDSKSSRLRYRALRNSSISAHRRSLYMIGAALFNHILSAINAARLAREANGKRSFGFQVRIDVEVGLGLVIVKTF